MSLDEYKRKRDFKKTPEPAGKKGKKAKAEEPLHFVVHKHQASHLHYDLRLELDGVLKSWAIPKGPTLDPEQKRLSMMVEDHPFDYRTFEGIIPEGNYGAGSVMIWDEGTYRALHSETRSESGKELNQGLEKGHISFILNGKKLKGEFALVHLKHPPPGSGSKDNSWLLIKKRDEFAGKTQTSDKDRSAASGRTMAEIAHDPDPEHVWISDRPASGKAGGKKSPAPVKPGLKSASPEIDRDEVNIEDAPVSDMPHDLRPMLATLVDDPFDRPGWLFEIKWDGYRGIAEIDKGKVSFYSRNLLPLDHKFPEIVKTLKQMNLRAVLDGEVVILDAEGRADFQLLQNYLRTGRGSLFYYVFDILYLEDRSLCGFPLRRRKYILKQVLPELPNIRVSDHIEEKGLAFFDAVAARGIEGMVAKDGASPYRPGVRGREWLKVKTHLRQEAVIGGFTAPRGGRKHLGSLVLGLFEDGDFVYIGHSGGGLTDKELAEIRSKLNRFVTKTSPFKDPPKTNAPVTWVKPELVCEVKFTEWTDEGYMRHPIYLGLREDKKPGEVKREIPAKTGEAVSRGPLRIAQDTKKQIVLNGIALELSNLDKVFWPEDGYTKGDMLEYYRDVASLMVPYLKDRPESMHRFPNGIYGDRFYQKDVDGKFPDWIETALLRSDSEDKDIRYLLCQNEAALIYIVNLGCIEINPLHVRVQSLDNPDYLVLDIDPLDMGFDRVVEAALATRAVLETAGAHSFCKTSGATGLHIYVPVGARYTTDQVVQFANLVNLLVCERLPETTSIERSPERREKKVYLDYLQNRRGQTLAAAYCIRPRKGAPVSAPLRWSEVNRKLNPLNFNIMTMRKRLDGVGDLWTGILGPGIDIESCLDSLTEEKHKKAKKGRRR